MREERGAGHVNDPDESRLIDTFRTAAEEAVRLYGEELPLDISPRAKGYTGYWKREPVGPCSLISPFNFPLNLAAHKMAPALAVGCPFVLKPASYTPVGALLIGEVLAETNLPRGAFSILPCRRDGADLRDEVETAVREKEAEPHAAKQQIGQGDDPFGAGSVTELAPEGDRAVDSMAAFAVCDDFADFGTETTEEA